MARVSFLSFFLSFFEWHFFSSVPNFYQVPDFSWKLTLFLCSFCNCIFGPSDFHFHAHLPWLTFDHSRFIDELIRFDPLLSRRKAGVSFLQKKARSERSVTGPLKTIKPETNHLLQNCRPHRLPLFASHETSVLWLWLLLVKTEF